MMLGERGNELVSHAVRKIILCGIARKISQRQHCDGLNLGWVVSGKKAVANSADIKSQHDSDQQAKCHRRNPPSRE
jgi:hypothetical protein